MSSPCAGPEAGPRLEGTDPCGVTTVLTLTVRDSTGRESTCTTSVTFDDDVAPELSSAPGDERVSCDHCGASL